MSTHYDVYCDDCKEFMGLQRDSSTNGGKGALQSLIKNRKEFLAIHKLQSELHHTIDVDVTIGYGAQKLDLEFFEKHARHKLRPRSEYERDKCDQDYVCSCGYEHACVLDTGHEGNHQPTEAVVCGGKPRVSSLTRKRP